MSKSISLRQAAASGIERLRRACWRDPLDHIKINIQNGKLGIWIDFWSPFNQVCNGRDPVDILAITSDLEEAAWLAYTGPLETSDEYKAACEATAEQARLVKAISHGAK